MTPPLKDEWRRGVALAATVAVLLVASGARAAATLDTAIDESASGNEAAAEAQSRIDALSGDIDALAAEYGATLQQTRALDVYNDQLAKLIVSQGKEIDELHDEISKVTVVGRSIMPLMAEMIDTLDQFVRLDLPFLPEERRDRVQQLRDMMDRADVTISEKYRRIMESYQIENEYGRTIEAYRGPLDAGGQNRTVDFLRIGRIALLYQTLDGQESGMWDPERKQWTTLDGSYRLPVQQGIRIARKQAAPDLLTVPLPAAGPVR